MFFCQDKLADLKERKKVRKQRRKDKQQLKQQQQQQQQRNKTKKSSSKQHIGNFSPRPSTSDVTCDKATSNFLSWCSSLLPSALNQASTSVSDFMKGMWRNDGSSPSTGNVESRDAVKTAARRAELWDINDTCVTENDFSHLQKDCRPSHVSNGKKKVTSFKQTSDSNSYVQLKTRAPKQNSKKDQSKKEWRTSATIPV